MKKLDRHIWMLLITVVVALVAITINLVSPSTMRDWVREDYIIENIQFLMYVVAAILQAYVLVKLENKRSRYAVFHLFFLVLFVFIAMEEISWGQRIFDWGTPGSMSAINVQNETNLHNIGSTDNIYIRYYLFAWSIIGIYLILIPIAEKFSKRVKDFVEKMQLPLANVNIAPLFIIGAFFVYLYLPTSYFIVGSVILAALSLLSFHPAIQEKASIFIAPRLQVAAILIIGILTMLVQVVVNAQPYGVKIMFEIRELIFAMCFVFFAYDNTRNRR